MRDFSLLKKKKKITKYFYGSCKADADVDAGCDRVNFF